MSRTQLLRVLEIWSNRDLRLSKFHTLIFIPLNFFLYLVFRKGQRIHLPLHLKLKAGRQAGWRSSLQEIWWRVLPELHSCEAFVTCQNIWLWLIWLITWYGYSFYMFIDYVFFNYLIFSLNLQSYQVNTPSGLLGRAERFIYLKTSTRRHLSKIVYQFWKSLWKMSLFYWVERLMLPCYCLGSFIEKCHVP